MSYLPVCETLSADSTLFTSTSSRKKLNTHRLIVGVRKAARRAPAGVTSMATTPIIPAALRSTRFALRLLIVPLIAPGIMANREVPRDTRSLAPNTTLMPGTSTAPPPTPSRADRTPEMIPSNTMPVPVSQVTVTCEMRDGLSKNWLITMPTRNTTKAQRRNFSESFCNSFEPTHAPVIVPIITSAPIAQFT